LIKKNPLNMEYYEASIPLEALFEVKYQEQGHMSCTFNYKNYYDKNPQCSSVACLFVNCLHREITYLNQYTCNSSDSDTK